MIAELPWPGGLVVEESFAEPFIGLLKPKFAKLVREGAIVSEESRPPLLVTVEEELATGRLVFTVGSLSIGTAVDSNDELASGFFLKLFFGLSRLILVCRLFCGSATLLGIDSVTDNLLCMLIPALEFEASGDSNLTVPNPRFATFGDRRAGEGEFDEVDEDDDEDDDDAVAVVVEIDDVEEFEVDLVEFDGDVSEGEVDRDKFGLPILFRL